MTTYAFPSIIASSSSIQLASNTGVHRSSESGSIQTFDRGGEVWVATFNFSNLTGAEKGELKGFLSKLNGQEHRFTTHDHGHVQRGTAGGGVTVNGGSQTGNTLNISGASAGWLLVGDWFAVDGHMKMVTVDCPGSTITFVPRITVAPSSGASLDDSNPAGTWMLSDNVNGWANRPNDLGDFTINCVEDLLA